MSFYHWLGIANFTLLGLAVVLSIHIMTGRHSKRKVFALASVVLILMLMLTFFSMLIYQEYHGSFPR